MHMRGPSNRWIVECLAANRVRRQGLRRRTTRTLD
jgi:hypothetical protein